MCQLSPVTFHGDTIYCINHQNQPYTPMRPIVENMGLDWGSQSQKLKVNRERWTVAMIATVAQDGIEREMLCMPVRKLPAYLASINPKKVRSELRSKIELYQAESDDALWNYWMNGRATRSAHSGNASPELVGNPDKLPLSTAASRAPLRSLVHAWAQISGVSHSALWPQVKAYFQLTRIDDLPENWIPDALAFVQEKIDQCGKGLPQAPAAPALPPARQERLPLYRDGSFYPPHKNRRHVAGQREKALMDFWTREYGQRVAELERQFNALADDLTAARGDLFCHAVSELGRSADTMFSIEAITEGLFAPLDCARDNFREALRLTRMHLRMAANVAVALNR